MSISEFVSISPTLGVRSAVFQPLLVVFRNSKNDNLVRLHVKDVRNTSGEYVRTKVYINDDLTPAEGRQLTSSAVYDVNADLFSATYNVSSNVLISSI